MQLKVQLHTLTKGSLAENLHPINDEDLIVYILNGLDSSYGNFITAFMMKSEALTVDDLIGYLL